MWPNYFFLSSNLVTRFTRIMCGEVGNPRFKPHSLLTLSLVATNWANYLKKKKKITPILFFFVQIICNPNSKPSVIESLYFVMDQFDNGNFNQWLFKKEKIQNFSPTYNQFILFDYLIFPKEWCTNYSHP